MQQEYPPWKWKHAHLSFPVSVTCSNLWQAGFTAALPYSPHLGMPEKREKKLDVASNIDIGKDVQTCFQRGFESSFESNFPESSFESNFWPPSTVIAGHGDRRSRRSCHGIFPEHFFREQCFESFLFESFLFFESTISRHWNGVQTFWP